MDISGRRQSLCEMDLKIASTHIKIHLIALTLPVVIHRVLLEDLEESSMVLHPNLCLGR